MPISSAPEASEKPSRSHLQVLENYLPDRQTFDNQQLLQATDAFLDEPKMMGLVRGINMSTQRRRLVLTVLKELPLSRSGEGKTLISRDPVYSIDLFHGNHSDHLTMNAGGEIGGINREGEEEPIAFAEGYRRYLMAVLKRATQERISNS